MSGQCTYTRQSLLALPTHWHYHPIARKLCAFVFDCVRTLVSIYVCVYVCVHLKTNYWLVKSSDSCACLYLHSHINFFFACDCNVYHISSHPCALSVQVPWSWGVALLQRRYIWGWLGEWEGHWTRNWSEGGLLALGCIIPTHMYSLVDEGSGKIRTLDKVSYVYVMWSQVKMTEGNSACMHVHGYMYVCTL